MLDLVHKEYKGLDIMKFVMAIVVVAIHTRPDMSFKSSIIKQIFDGMYSIAVPYFFMASGFLLFRKISLPLTWEGEQRIQSYLARMCRLYLVWTVIYLPLTVYGFYIDGVPPHKAIAVFFRNVLLVGENYMSWPLWYLLALIVAVTIIYGLLKLKISKKWIVVISTLMAIVGVALDYCDVNNLLKPITDIYFSIFLKTRNGFFVGFLFVALGMLCSKCERLLLWQILSLLVIGVLGIIYGIPLSYALVTVAVFVLSISPKCYKVVSATTSKLRGMSTVVYFVHMYALSALVLFANYRNGATLFFVVVMFSLTLALILMQYNSNKVISSLFV